MTSSSDRDKLEAAQGPSRRCGPGVIVVGVDQCDSAMRALAWALGLAERSGAAIVGLHVARCAPTAEAMANLAGIAAVQLQIDPWTTDEHLGAQLLDVARHSGLSADIERVVGDPAQEIIRAAHRYRADLIVIGAARTRRSSRRSIAARLVVESRCPLTVVP
jgi:nucleotide-binding universal stress UspA family protein